MFRSLTNLRSTQPDTTPDRNQPDITPDNSTQPDTTQDQGCNTANIVYLVRFAHGGESGVNE